MGDRLCDKAVESVGNGTMAFFKELSGNDTGKTGAHQSGILIPKSAKDMLDVPDIRGSNPDRYVKVRWQGDFETESRIVFYGKKKNEYRLTRFGRGFELLKPENRGALFIFVRRDEDYYEGWILTDGDEIQAFLDRVGMTLADAGQIIGSLPQVEDQLLQRMDSFIQSLNGGFPSGRTMSETARNIYNTVYDHIENVILAPDDELLAWNKTEYTLFRRIEEVQFGKSIRQGFPSMQAFVDVANSILNRRKSRAGKSLEYHLEEIFRSNSLKFDSQAITEEHKKPDFIFPSGAAYHDSSYPADKLVVLGAKTTCKDRWRQVVTEANRVNKKYLCTLQNNISENQLDEMHDAGIVLVVPKPYIPKYPKAYQGKILDLKTFIKIVHQKTE